MAAIPGLSAAIYLDHNVDPQLAADLKTEGYDVVFADEIGMAGALDEEHLRFAAANGRAIVSHDLRDFQVLADNWAERGLSHAGIVLVHQPPRVPYGELRRRMLALLNRRTAEELVDQIVWLSIGP